MTARDLCHLCRKAGIILAADADRITFDAPAAVAVPIKEIRQCKAELLALLRGDYLNAAAALVLTVDDSDQRAELAHLFDERAGICQYEDGMSRRVAERQAYMQLARVGQVDKVDTCRRPVLASDKETEVGRATLFKI